MLEPLPWAWWLADLTLVDGYEQITRARADELIAATHAARDPGGAGSLPVATMRGAQRQAASMEHVQSVHGAGGANPQCLLVRRAGSTRARGAGVDVDWDGCVETGTRAEHVRVEAERGTGVAAAPWAAKDTAVRWAQSETGSPKRVRGAAQVDAGQNGVASATLGRSGVERVQVVVATERVWQRTGGGRGSGVDAGWDGRGERIQHRGGNRNGHGLEGASYGGATPAWDECAWCRERAVVEWAGGCKRGAQREGQPESGRRTGACLRKAGGGPGHCCPSSENWSLANYSSRRGCGGHAVHYTIVGPKQKRSRAPGGGRKQEKSGVTIDQKNETLLRKVPVTPQQSLRTLEPFASNGPSIFVECYRDASGISGICASYALRIVEGVVVAQGANTSNPGKRSHIRRLALPTAIPLRSSPAHLLDDQVPTIHAVANSRLVRVGDWTIIGGSSRRRTKALVGFLTVGLKPCMFSVSSASFSPNKLSTAALAELEDQLLALYSQSRRIQTHSHRSKFCRRFSAMFQLAASPPRVRSGKATPRGRLLCRLG
ncbi:hypothetical protein B0H14DRAFT_2589521 [Mycena olivaceomarginata]|nr:hypothetical protein B0H14DRAFT_2589521 [Mycena olivaceomarginata]